MLQEEDIPEVFYCVDCIILNTDGKENTDLVYKYRGKELKVTAFECCLKGNIVFNLWIFNINVFSLFIIIYDFNRNKNKTAESKVFNIL